MKFMAVITCNRKMITLHPNLHLLLFLLVSSLLVQEFKPTMEDDGGQQQCSSTSTSTSAALPGSIAQRWKELNGENQWDGLLDPLDLDLRYNIILYGEMAQGVYDTFIKEKKSKFAGAPRFARKDFLHNTATSLGQPSLYQVTKYIYATSSLPSTAPCFVKSLSQNPWCEESNWMAFVAVATDAGKKALGRRDVVVGWRGTLEMIEWLEDFDNALAPATGMLRPGPSGMEPRVHRGFMSIYNSSDSQSRFNKDSARNQVLEELRRLMEVYKQEDTSITVTGHSLGGSLAILNAIDIAVNAFDEGKAPPSVTAFAFANPRVGDFAFSDACAGTKGLHLLRVRYLMDPVPTYPFMGYADSGVELLIDYMKSPFLKRAWSLPMAHNLECYLHGVAGTHGSLQDFKLVINRDVALVNKGIDALKDEYLVPDSWWVAKDKCMVQGADGHWTLQDHEKDNLA